MAHLCSVTWTTGAVPAELGSGLVVPIFKRGDWSVCSNYGGITLLSLAGQVSLYSAGDKTAADCLKFSVVVAVAVAFSI